MEWFILLVPLFIGLAIFGWVQERKERLPLEREVRERGLERLVFNQDKRADPDVKVGYVEGIKVLYWDERCFETAKGLLKWRDRSRASILRLRLDALEEKDEVCIFSHRWGSGPFSTLSEVHAEDDRRRNGGNSQ